MMKNYFSRAALLLGATAIIGSSTIDAEAAGAWRNVNYLLTNVSGIDGWNGNVTESAGGVAAIIPGAGLFYLVYPDLPAGTYTLELKGFNRVTDAPGAYKLRVAGKEEINCYAFLNDKEVKMHSLFDATTQNLLVDGEYQWGIVPNTLGEARTFFDAGQYLTTVTCEHPGGDLHFGVRNYGSVGIDEWTAFGDFKLTGPDGEVELPEIGAFDKEAGWKAYNADGAIKGRGLQNGAMWSKTNASPYNEAQTLTVEPGKYRFAIQSFNEHFLGSHNGYCVPMKGSFAYRTDIPSAKDLYDSGATQLGSGQVKGEENWNPTTFFKMEALEAYLCIYYGGARMGGFDESDPDKLHNFWMEGDWEGKYDVNNANLSKDFDALPEGQWAQVKIKNIFDENLPEYVECQNYMNEDGEWVYTWTDGDGIEQPTWWESGCNFMAAALFVAHPELYQNYVELEVTGTEPQEITVAWRKDINQNNYWNPVFDIRLEKWDAEYDGYIPAGAEQGEEPDIKGSGTKDDPYLIATAADLCEAHNLIDQENPGDYVYFKQTADIDMANADYTKWQALLGWYGAYVGKINYDGDNHVIRNFHPTDKPSVGNAKIAEKDMLDGFGGYYDTSLFGILRGEVKNLGVIDYVGIDTTKGGAAAIGGYAGFGEEKAIVTNVFVTGKASGAKRNGAIAAHLNAENIYTQVYAVIDVNSTDAPAGGLVGNLNGQKLTIDEGYVAATISGTPTTQGLIAGGKGTVNVYNFVTIGQGDCFAADAVVAMSDLDSPKFDSYTSQAQQCIQDMDAFNEGKELKGMPTFNWMTDAQIAGVDNVTVDSDNEAAPAVYYNLQGVRVENPANGLYIKKQGNKVSKVVIR